MAQQTSTLRRALEHVAAAVTLALPLNALITYSVASMTSNPLLITLSTSLLATLISFGRTYLVLLKQDQRELALAAK